LHPYPNPSRGAGASSNRAPAYKMPGWVKVFAVVALFAVAIVTALHLAGLGPRHLPHGGTVPQAPLAGHGQHQP
jgi:hypothetical protein